MTKNGADSLTSTLADNGIDTCFTNPGTTEMHLLAAFGRENRIRSHLCLFEGVASGAADGYARMARKPAVTLLHLGPGFANAMANLHNARKAQTPVLNIVGDHAAYHKEYDAPLNADIEGMARPVSDWVATAETADRCGPLAAEAVARIRHGGVATLAVTNDAAWSETEVAGSLPNVEAAPSHDPSALPAAVEALRKGGTAMLVVGGTILTARAARLAHDISQATGCRVITESISPRVTRGGDIPPLARIPFHVDLATEALKDVRHVVLAGAKPPVAFFAYPGRPSALMPAEAETVKLSPPASDAEATLEALHEAVGATHAPYAPAPLPEAPADGPITPEGLASLVARSLPENAIVIDEAITSGAHLYPACGAAKPHDWLANRGGSIGISTPLSVGCAVACPDRKVLCLVGDGSAFYTLQSLWTMARYRLDVTVVVLANRSYRILNNEMSKIGAGDPSDSTIPLMSLDDPAPDWVQLARGHGVDATSVGTHAGLRQALEAAMAEPGPRLIEAVLA